MCESPGSIGFGVFTAVAQVQSLVKELRFHKLLCTVQLKKKKFYLVYYICAVLINSGVSDSATLRTAAHQATLSMGILQARILESVAMPSSRGSSQLRDRIQVSHIASGFFTIWATREAHLLDLCGIFVDYMAHNRLNSKRHMYTNIHCIVIYNSQDMEAT